MPPGNFDDGIQLVGAMLWLRGKTPNIDFYAVYPPLNVYLLGGMFRLLGESIVAYRALQTLAYAVTMAAFGCLCWRLPKALRLWTWLLLLALNNRIADLQPLTALMWSTLAATCVLSARSRARAAPAGAGSGLALQVAAGACLAALSWTRLNFGFYFASALAFDAALSFARDRSTLRASLQELAAVGCTAGVLLLAFWLGWGGSLASLLQQAVFQPAQNMIDYALAPVPRVLNLHGLVLILVNGLLVVALVPAWLALGSRRRVALLVATLVVLAAAFLVGAYKPTALPIFTGLLLLLLAASRLRGLELARDEWLALSWFTIQTHYTLSRPDGAHFFALFPSLSVLLAVSLAQRPAAARAGVIALTLCLFGGGAAYTGYVASRELAQRWQGVRAIGRLLETRDAALFSEQCGPGCAAYLTDPDEMAAAAFIRERTSESEAVYAGLLDHSRTVVNNMRSYWLMRRPAGTHHIMLVKRASTGEKNEREIVTDLQTNNVRWLLLWQGLPDKKADVSPSLVDSFIREHYKPHKRFGAFEVWERET